MIPPTDAPASTASSDPAPEIDVVVVSYNRVDHLLRCCESVLAADEEVRLVVVDNASDDGSAETARSRFPEATVMELEHNVGFAAGINRGVAEGTAPRILMLNNDARLRSGSLTRLREAIDADPECGAAGPRIVAPDGAVELSTGRTLSPWNELLFRIVETLYRQGGGPLAPWVDHRYRRPRETRSLTGACIMLRRRAFEEVGGMDERFFLYAEDVDLCRRLRQAEWRLRFVPDAVVEHERGASGEASPEAVERHYRRSQLAYYRKHHGRLAARALRAYLFLRYLWVRLVAAGERRGRASRMLRWLGDRDG